MFTIYYGHSDTKDGLPALGQSEPQPSQFPGAHDTGFIPFLKIKGLCLRCGQAHKCPEGKLQVLLMGDDEYEYEEGEHFLLDTEDSPAMVDALLKSTCMPLEFIDLLAETGGAKTLRFNGALQGIPVNMLVDSGVTHNFILRRLVLALGLPFTKFSGICIKLRDGRSIVTERRLQLPNYIGSCTFLIDTLVFDIGSLDLILCMVWRQSFG
ncbi:hypothetical protein E3N88_14322 [Mikania micrantha]|uniref:Uncharacterized protein n=1 Tax=Mikania micrantha TaxID=192012 RepID=A0A5N6P1F4_9ASTR|nr:hypothetical protein E3N88_14322 [Mikania micrantha]